MDKYTRELFKDKCPYTDYLCTNDMPCNLCEVEQLERKMAKEIMKGE